MREGLLMGSRKTDEWARKLRVLSHPTRLMILEELLKGVKCVNDMTELLELPQPNVSQHLMALREAGLVECRQHGLFRCYYLPKPALVRGLFDVLGKDYRPVVPPRGKIVAASGQTRRKTHARRKGRQPSG